MDSREQGMCRPVWLGVRRTPSNTDGLSELICSSVAFVFGVILAVLLTLGVVNARWQSAAIKRGYAEFNQQNGQWQWKQPAEKP